MPIQGNPHLISPFGQGGNSNLIGPNSAIFRGPQQPNPNLIDPNQPNSHLFGPMGINDLHPDLPNMNNNNPMNLNRRGNNNNNPFGGAFGGGSNSGGGNFYM